MGVVDLRRAVISSVVALILSFILFIFCSVLTSLSILPDGAIRAVVIIITSLASLIAGFLTSRNVYEYGLINGLVTGFIFFLMLYLLSMLLTLSFAFNGLLFKSLLFILIFSGIGGIAGINSKTRRRKRRSTYKRRY